MQQSVAGRVEGPHRASAPSPDARTLRRVLSLSGLRPHLLAGITLHAHEGLPGYSLRGGLLEQPGRVSPVGAQASSDRVVQSGLAVGWRTDGYWCCRAVQLALD